MKRSGKSSSTRTSKALVAKPLGSVYNPGERGWLKVKNRGYWKYLVEQKGHLRAPAARNGHVEPL